MNPLHILIIRFVQSLIIDNARFRAFRGFVLGFRECGAKMVAPRKSLAFSWLLRMKASKLSPPKVPLWPGVPLGFRGLGAGLGFRG